MEELIRRTVGPSVKVEVVGAADIWTSRVDPNQLENALLNLCINARDAMPEGGSLMIETGNQRIDDRGAGERDVPAGQYVTMSVTDTGTGMTRGGDRASVRSFLHDQAPRLGNRSRAVDDLWVRPPVGGTGPDLLGGRAWCHGVSVSAASHRGGRGRRSATQNFRRRPTPARARQSSWSMTSPSFECWWSTC